MRNWFSMGFLAVTILFGVNETAAAAPVTAITLSAGDSVTLNFDFVDAGVTPAPPYAKILMSASFTGLDSGDSGTVEFWSDLNAAGTLFVTVNGPEFLPGIILPNLAPAIDGIFSMRVTLTAGSLTLVDPGATGFDAEGTGTPVVYGVEVQQVPEPATMMLLGLGLAGVGVRRIRAVARRGSHM